ncbi:PaaI family thioesterase [Ideonella sp. A 288]|uniref:PaaI family thioesterase n=1 Tax=Ideonella sp. A 288 TaxID=1962181 RepID=UPI000B4AF483|nr:PaaI family thioesterase [Ideonella sp. A 288]
MSERTHLPADPSYEARIRDSFDRQGAMATIGATLDLVEPGHVVVGLPHSPRIGQQHGFVHAGMLAAALDTACGYAASTLMPADAGVLTIEFKINLLAPARGPHLRCEGQVAKAGRTISVVDGRAWGQAPDGAPVLVATMTATVMTITGRDGVRH